MAVLYIREQGTTVAKDGERIRILKGGRAILERPLIGIESIAIFGNVQITSQAIHMILEAGIDIDYFSFSGKYLGRLAAESSKAWCRIFISSLSGRCSNAISNLKSAPVVRRAIRSMSSYERLELSGTRGYHLWLFLISGFRSITAIFCRTALSQR